DHRLEARAGHDTDALGRIARKARRRGAAVDQETHRFAVYLRGHPEMAIRGLTDADFARRRFLDTAARLAQHAAAGHGKAAADEDENADQIEEVKRLVAVVHRAISMPSWPGSTPAGSSASK